ncbi:MAG: hypothetical protein EPN22_03965 [Nitrospirae bacterium]|nr:MAG: hypothetical protein EPN22_03965 [Nitrospirota bacterium]
MPIYSHAGETSLHGFFQGNYSVNTSSKNPNDGGFKWVEERVQLKLDASKEPFRLFIKADALLDHVDPKGDVEIREGYLDYTSKSWDARLGRQVVTWGLGDMIFINDVFPKDYEAFFSGRPMEYLKKGVDGLKVGVYPDFASFELIAIPFFEPNNFPSSKRFWTYDPMPAVTARSYVEPTAKTQNTETALRAYRDIAGFDTSLYYYKGFYRQPSMTPDHPTAPARITYFYPKLSVFGASAQGRMFDGVLSMEAGYYDSRQDRKGADPMIPNPQTRFLIGYQKQLWEDFTAGFQYYTEYMRRYEEYVKNLPAGFPKERRVHELATIRLTQMLMHQTLRLSLFSIYSPSDGDHLLNPEVKYNFSDNVWAALGANFFGGGERRNQFGQLARNDNAYIQVRYEF